MKKNQNEAMARDTGKRHVNCQPRGSRRMRQEVRTDRRIQTKKAGAFLEQECSSAIISFG